MTPNSYYGGAYDEAVAGGVGAYFPYQAPLSGVRGTGDASQLAPLANTAGIVWLVARGVGGYLVGRAIAPQRSDRGTYGWVGALVGTFTGPIGLGIMGVMALEAKD